MISKLLKLLKEAGSQSGYMLPLLLGIFGVIVVLMLLTPKFPGPGEDGCRVGRAVDPLKEKSVMLPPINNVGKFRYGFDGGPDLTQPPVEYVLIRKDVPIFTNTKDPNYVIGYPDWMGKDGGHPHIKWPIIADFTELGRNADPRHTVLYSGANQAGFDVYYANSTGEVELPFSMTDRAGHSGSILTLRTEGFLIFVHLDKNGKPVKINYGLHIYYLVDWYQDKRLYLTPPSVKHYEIDDMFHCIDPDAPANPKLVRPSQNPSQDQEQLQLEWFLLEGAPGMYAHCKPAVYLYPETKKLVNVKVSAKGELTYSDPKYDHNLGWTVFADPSGKLITENQDPVPANYLYYETKLLDRFIKKPTHGWVVEKSKLEDLFNQKLPMLGLNPKEANDFKNYWLTKLPDSRYYFVGVVEKDQRDFLEPLTVTPNPDTSIRFSFYFEPLNEFKQVEAPEIVTPKRAGFTLVDWGGMIKLHPGTKFTCSQ